MADGKGQLKVFIGMAPGVGKTYRMLSEGRGEALSGRDVVIGYLEPHGRAETVEQAGELEVVPRRKLRYRGVPMEEMDLPAILERKPELCLIDELAHTNVPGVEHEKRYEDVLAVLEAGIDVYSTVNVQHLESLNDQIAQLTGATVRETVPDAVLSEADEVVLVDLTPEALVARLRAGKVYRPERVQAALNNFFKIENLSALRETALRQVAAEVEVKRLVKEERPLPRRDQEGLTTFDDVGPQAIAERLLALSTLGPDSERVLRRAWRSAQRLDADLDVLIVRDPRRPAVREDRDRLEEIRRLTSMLGVRLRVEEGEDPAEVAIRVAQELGTTYLLMGPPPVQGKGFSRLGGGAERSLLMRVLRGLPGVDIRVVSDPTQRRSEPAETGGSTVVHGREPSGSSLGSGSAAGTP